MRHVVYIYSLRLPPLASAAAFPYLSTPIFQLRSHLPTTPQTNQSESRTESEREIIGGDTIRRAAAVLHAAILPLQRSPPLRVTRSPASSARGRFVGDLAAQDQSKSNYAELLLLFIRMKLQRCFRRGAYLTGVLATP